MAGYTPVIGGLNTYFVNAVVDYIGAKGFTLLNGRIKYSKTVIHQWHLLKVRLKKKIDFEDK
jgi:hypothetical protein